MNQNKLQSNIFLLATAIIWGFAFVAQKSGMDYIGPFLFSGVRMWIGCLSLLPVIYYFDKKQPVIKEFTEDLPDKKKDERKVLLQGGIACGIIIYFAANFQQVGLVFTDAGKTGFITTLYIVLVPLFGMALRHKVTANNWIGVVLASAGLYFLCLTESFTIAFGDLIVLIGAGFWAAHILVIDHYAPKVNAMKLIFVQFFIAGGLSFITAIIREPINFAPLVSALPTLLYAGVMSSAVAFTFQTLGQRNANPTTASLILSTEAVFAVLGGMLLLSESLSQREILGCVLMFIAVVISQIEFGSKNIKKAI